MAGFSKPERDESFPGERTWRFHMQMRVDRVIAPGRLLLLLANFAAWRLLPPIPGAIPWLAWALTIVAVLYVLADAVVRARWQRTGERIPYGSVVMDMVLVGLWILATGGSQSPFLIPLLFVGVVSAPFRLTVPGGVLATLFYVALSLVFGHGPALIVTRYSVGLLGLSLTLWTHILSEERRSALRDPLTGVFGREYALFRLRQVMKQKQFPMSVALVDLDGFKGVNDTLGHVSGDQTLQRVARLIMQTVRSSDLVARYGGDEFLVLCPETGLEAAKEIARRIEEAVGAMSVIGPDGTQLALGATAGVAEAAPGSSLTSIIKAADEELYAAKQQKKKSAPAARAATFVTPRRGRRENR